MFAHSDLRDPIRAAVLERHIQLELVKLARRPLSGLSLPQRFALWRRRRTLAQALTWLDHRPASRSASVWREALRWGVPLAAVAILADLLFRRSTLDPLSFRIHVIVNAIVWPLWAAG